MASAILISYFLCIIFMEVNLLNATVNEFLIPHDTTNYTSSWKSARRSKRSLYDEMPLHLKIKVRYATEEEVELHWIKKKQYLANEHLPVFTTLDDSRPNVMTNVGNFILYRDAEKCSAVVYFENFNSFYGVIGTDHLIQALPFDFDEHGQYRLGVADGTYVKKRDHSFFHTHPDIYATEDHVNPPNNLNRGIKRPFDGEPGPSTKHQRTEQNFGEILHVGDTITVEPEVSVTKKYWKYYDFRLETVIFVTHDIAQLFKLQFGEGTYIEWIVIDHIIHFNAVNMVFEKLLIETGRFYINIARIIVEDNSVPLDFMMNNGGLQFTDITTRLPQYLQRFKPDSFDYVFIHSSRSIMDQLLMTNNGFITRYGADLFEARKDNRFYDVVPFSVVGFEYYNANYVLAVHEIGRIFNMKIDSQEAGLKSIGQCHSIMQRGGPKCDECLKWSDDSWEQFKTFFRENRNRCFLLNEPRSLHPPNRIFADLTPFEQCQCFGYPSNVKTCRGTLIRQVGINGCKQPIQCQNVDGTQSNPVSTVRPFDGTNCSPRKVCWNGQCVEMSGSIRVRSKVN